MAIAAAASLIAFPAPAHAVYERTCTYQSLLTFSPGLLAVTPRLVDITNAGGNRHGEGDADQRQPRPAHPNWTWANLDPMRAATANVVAQTL